MDNMATDLKFVRSGKAGGPVLLLIHPMGADLAFWDRCRALWDGQYDSIAVSLHGAGSAGRATAPRGPDLHAADIEGLCRALALNRIIPVGCAVGSMVATSFAAQFPDRCSGLVLSNPGYRTAPSARDMLFRRAARARRDGMAAVVNETLDAAFAGPPDDPVRMQYAARFAVHDPGSYAFAIEGMLDADVSERARSISCPALVVGGGQDVLLPVSVHALSIHQAISGSDYVEIEDGAHFIPVQQAERFTALVRGFVNGLKKTE